MRILNTDLKYAFQMQIPAYASYFEEHYTIYSTQVQGIPYSHFPLPFLHCTKSTHIRPARYDSPVIFSSIFSTF